VSRPCSVPGCDRPHVARGWCKLHYYRWKRAGDPLLVRPPGFPPRERPPCAVPDCEKQAKRGGRGWCAKHHTRWVRHGDPSIDGNQFRKTVPVLVRIRERIVDGVGGCWIYEGTRLPSGYGTVGIGLANHYVHRVMWEAEYGPIPDGLQLHHRCQTKPCCNPAHLELVIPAEHAERHRKAIA
jgi:HNH endonuclease